MPEALTPAAPSEAPGVLASLPRRAMLAVSPGLAAPSQMRFLNFKFSRARALARLFTWFGLLWQFVLATLVDVVLRRDSPARRARRLRHEFEQRGGAFVKLGLHLSMRVDFMPWEFSVELSRMRDRLRPFPVADAIAIVERGTGRPLPALFRRFDPQPIASTSVACVYQAILHTGEEVIVRVRRPGIGGQFMADLQAFDWLLTLAEVLTIFRPGLTKGMREEFRDYLLEELDFVQAARRQDSFRRAAAEARKDFFSAPQVYLGLSGEEVVVEEFAAGMWLWELLAAVEQGNTAVLEQARQMNIDPRKVAKRLLWVHNWSWGEHLFFHADPHPNNIILGHNSRLYFINFTNTGSLSRSQRQAFQQNMDYLRQRDPLNMARSSLTLLEPLPSIDVIELTQELESYNWQLVYALEADPESLAWQERTSVAQWMGLIRLARKNHIVIDSRVLRLLRATLLVESVAVRLHPTLDVEKQFRKFERYRAEQARRRVTDSLVERLEGKANHKLIIRLDRIAHTLTGLFFRTRRLLALPSVNFNALMSKWSFAVYILVRFVVQALLLTGAAALLAAAGLLLGGRVDLLAPAFVLRAALTHPLVLLGLLGLIFANGRTVLFRMDDVER